MRVLIKREQIKRRINELAKEISRNSESAGNAELDLVVILNGAAVFANELADRILAHHGPLLRVHYLMVSSYVVGTVSSENVKISGNVPLFIGRDVLIVEDIVDTGLTVAEVKKRLSRARTLKTCALLDKPSRRRPELKDISLPDYTGFQIPDVFVAGYGLDYAGLHRELPYIAAVDTDNGA